jgi:hypothetical protein
MEHLGANQTGPKKLLQNTGNWQLDTDLLANFEFPAYAKTNTYHVAKIYQETIQVTASWYYGLE